MDSESANILLKNLLEQHERDTTTLGQELLKGLDLSCQSLHSGSDFVQQVRNLVGREVTPIEERELVELYARACKGQPGGSTPSDFGSNLYQALNQLVGFAETKLSALIAANVTIVVLLLPNKPSIPHPSPGFEQFFNAWAGFITFCIALVLFFASAILAVLAFYLSERIKSQYQQENVVFWKWIVKQQASQYQRDVESLDSLSINDAYAIENHRLSKELEIKNNYLLWSVVTFILGLFFALVSTGLSFILR